MSEELTDTAGLGRDGVVETNDFPGSPPGCWPCWPGCPRTRNPASTAAEASAFAD
jgi:hypothetical protein